MTFKFPQMITLLLSILLLCGCQAADDGTSDQTPSPDISLSERIGTIEGAQIPFSAVGAAQITLSDEGTVSDSTAVDVAGSVVTIREGGSYIVTGTLSDGMLVIDCDKSQEVSLLLRDAHITCSTNAALYVASLDTLRLYTDANTENTLASSYDFSLNTETNVDAALFSRDDLYLCGEGMLTVVSAYGHGVVSKDDLTVVSGIYDMKTASHGISGKDSVTVMNGTFTIDCGKDGIHAENKDDSALGNLYLMDGDYTITSAGDCLSASAMLQIDGGAYTLTSGGGAAYGEQHTNEMFGGGKRGEMFGGWGTEQTESAETDDASAVDSAKGIKAQTLLYIKDGVFRIDAADDALHSNGDLTVQGGQCSLASGDDAMHADSTLSIKGGEIAVMQSYEGLEGTSILISGGEISILATDDGINAAGGADGSGFFGFGGGKDIFSSDGVSEVEISGGYLYMNAGGDGLDSNGDLTITGGEIYVDGPTNGANGAVDCAGEAIITGGKLVAVGSAQMAESLDNASTQGVALVTLQQTQNASELSLYDANGTLLLSHSPQKTYNAVYISCPEMSVGSTYTLVTGDLETQITMDDVVVGSSGFGIGGFGGGQGGFGGGMGGNKGNRGDRGDFGEGGQMPEGVNPPAMPDGGEIPSFETDESGNPVIPEIPEGGFDFDQMPGGFGGEVPEGMIPPEMPEGGQMPEGVGPGGQMPQGGFGGMAPPAGFGS